MSIDPDSDTKVATIAKVRESSTNQDDELPDTESVEDADTETTAETE